MKIENPKHIALPLLLSVLFSVTYTEFSLVGIWFKET